MPLLDLSGGWHRDRSERRAVIEGVVADVGEVCGEVDVGEGSAPLEGKVLRRRGCAQVGSSRMASRRGVPLLEERAKYVSMVRRRAGAGTCRW